MHIPKDGAPSVLTGYSRDTHGVLMWYSWGMHGVIKGYSRDTHGVLACAVARAVSYHQPWTHFLLWVDLACILPIVLRMWYRPPAASTHTVL